MPCDATVYNHSVYYSIHLENVKALNEVETVGWGGGLFYLQSESNPKVREIKFPGIFQIW